MCRNINLQRKYYNTRGFVRQLLELYDKLGNEDHGKKKEEKWQI